ncbi:dipeptide ABC transporter ATP-binding protein [Alicyclobacillus cycloheptanicus]|uniref:Oligopeptide/dipeptide ABC transporter ATP-binding protein n=1 Tax=Alicyclobacillus cycloheptanicus TaxID=1457 RepID=A0ABT9XFD7_9BACL|nr:dipeptide ABC transporter ATP-binding protein [Alicyclobacillus cycloheptanicus]MDQ0189014.1 oligopeptide/dipeptide ABC transporter ATP-binding protein [Alicyclobacillus cycloheptanicus]WDM01647.1 dipeptide ABC transporter ATP-binding protein [Alicyclobacillus cycloheptanicus]
MSDTLLQVQELTKYFPIKQGVFRRTVGHVRAVDGVTFELRQGQTLGVVGESGCGKSTMGRSILRLIEPTSGVVEFEGKNVIKMSRGQMRAMRREMQIVFQDPYASLNPRFSIQQTLMEPMVIHGLYTPAERAKRVRELLERVGLDPDYAKRYPHEFSGGQRQRIGIARALAVNPKLIMLDEPVAALDVSVQSQVLNLLEDLQQEYNLTYIFVAHDLSVVRHISDQIMVLYLGKMAELADSDELFHDPLHPYTRALLSAVPIPDPDVKRERIILQGDLPSPANPPTGCVFHTRCPMATDVCKQKRPEWKEVKPNHHVACHLY